MPVLSIWSLKQIEWFPRFPSLLNLIITKALHLSPMELAPRQSALITHRYSYSNNHTFPLNHPLNSRDLCQCNSPVLLKL